MSKLLKVQIDLTKIKKEHIFNGEKGKYISLDIWINDEPDQYGNDAGVKQSYKVGDDWQSHYIGNGKKKSGWESSPVAKVEQGNESNINDLPFIITVLIAVGSLVNFII